MILTGVNTWTKRKFISDVDVHLHDNINIDEQGKSDNSNCLSNHFRDMPRFIFSLNNDVREGGREDAGRGWRIGAEFTFHFAVAMEPGHVETFRNCYVKLFRF